MTGRQAAEGAPWGWRDSCPAWRVQKSRPPGVAVAPMGSGIQQADPPGSSMQRPGGAHAPYPLPAGRCWMLMLGFRGRLT